MTAEAVTTVDDSPQVRPAARRAFLRLRRRTRALCVFLADHPYLITLGLIAFITVVGWRGPDWPAQYFRAWLARDGAMLWNNQWYGGHLLPGYSIISPLISGGIGTRLTTALACLLAAWAWSRLRVGRAGLAQRVGAAWFGVMVSVEYLIGRTPFILGVASGLLALLAARSNHRVWAGIAALMCGLASPLAAAFLLMVALAWVPEDQVWRTRLSLAPAGVGLVLPMLFPGGSDFGFPLWRLLAVLAFAAAGLILIPRGEKHRSARRFLWLYALSSTVLFVVPTAVGGNVARLGEMTAGPLAAVVLLSLGRRRLVVLLAVPILAWQFQSASVAVAHDAQDNAGADASYYTGVIAFLNTHNQPVERVEIPFTRGHWETRFVAEQQPLARGWERQLDLERNKILYDTDLTADEYHAWLLNNGVRYVALPDVPLDQSSNAESGLLRAGQPWLHQVWSDKHWRVWEVTDHQPLLEGAGRLTSITANGFTFTADSPGTFTVRIHHTSWFTADMPGTKISATPDGWTQITVPSAGTVTVTAQVSAVLP